MSRYGTVRRLRCKVGVYAGQVREYPDEIADELIALGRAEDVDAPKAKPKGKARSARAKD